MTTNPATLEDLKARIDSRMEQLRDHYGSDRLARVEEFVQVMTGAKRVRPASALQRPVLYFFPGITDRAWHDTVPAWMERLEGAFPVIRRELDGLLARQADFTPYVHGSDADYRSEKFKLGALSKNWTVYDLLEPVAESQCPETSRLIGELFRPEFGEPVTAQFSALRPGARIAPHCGIANFFLTAHMGLVHSDGCSIRVGAETRGWVEGRGFVFDDSFEHEVWHDGDGVRIVFLARFWHPELTDEEIESIGSLHECVIEAAGATEGAQREALMRLRGER